MLQRFLKMLVVELLFWEARCAIRRFKPSILAVTGSVGKTSTKDAIYAVFREGRVRKSEKSFNSEIGVPLTILGLPNAWNSVRGWLANLADGFFVCVGKRSYPHTLVLEAGVDRPRDMQRLRHFVFDTVVFTRFPDTPVHVEHFDSREALIAEKRLLKNFLSEKGALVVNADDPEMQDERVRAGQTLIRCGFSEEAEVHAEAFETLFHEGVPSGIGYRAVVSGKVPVRVVVEGVLGKHHVYPSLFALGVCLSRNLPFPSVQVGGVEEWRLSQGLAVGRMHPFRGVNGSVVIDDTYNASPVALESALETLVDIPHKEGGRRIVVLGDMLDLGTFSVEAHARAGEQVAGCAEAFFAVGVRMQKALSVAQEKNPHLMVMSCKDAREAGEKVANMVRENDIILVKGSQSVRMERAVEVLLANPADRALLPRRGKEWEKR